MPPTSDQVVTGLCQHFKDAVDAGVIPDETWLVPLGADQGWPESIFPLSALIAAIVVGGVRARHKRNQGGGPGGDLRSQRWPRGTPREYGERRQAADATAGA